jgi:serine/threonine protein kinase
MRSNQSLYVQGNILHRDISSNNILITDPGTADGFKGMLIDLDLAKVRDSCPSGARHRTGTVQFMAIEVLLRIDHTYRYDLEPFFYVLLWMCARQAWSNGLGDRNRLRIANLKNGRLQTLQMLRRVIDRKRSEKDYGRIPTGAGCCKAALCKA